MKMKKMLALLLAMVMLIGLLPVTALAAGVPKLVMCYVNEDGSPSEEYTNGWFPVFCHYVTYYPALLIGGALLPIDPALLYPADPSALSVVPSSEYAGAVYMESLKLGETELLYNHSDGRTYRFDVHAGIVSVGFFSNPDGAGLNYLESFTACEGNDTVYLIVRNGWTIEDLSLEHFANDCTYTISPDKSMATITIGPDAEPPAFPYAVPTILDQWGQLQEWTIRLDLTTAFPDLYFRYAGWSENGTLIENFNMEPERKWTPVKGSKQLCFFYFHDTETETRLTADHLYSTNEEVVTVSADPQNPEAIQMTATGFGTAEIVYEHNGRTYRFPFHSELPGIGFYAAPYRSEATFVDEVNGFTHSPHNNTVYLILGDEFPDSTITNLYLFEDQNNPFPEGSTFKIAEDGRSAAITLGETTSDEAWYYLWYDVTTPPENVTEEICNALLSKYDPSAPARNPFMDVTDTDWYSQPVMWAVQNNVTGGLTAATFGPNASCTRAQVVTFLYAAAGKPEVNPTTNPFTDVSENDWFYAPVMWAVENGITGGLTANTFGPNVTCTRAQVVTFLYAAAGKPAPTSTDHPFTDVNSGDWYLNPVLWAVEKGVTGGKTANTFAPNETCTRAQVVTFLYANETK